MTDLDQALRTMLRERAADITTVPADFSDLDSLDVLNGGSERAGHRRAHWWMFAAAAAIVALVVGVTVAIRDRDTTRPHPVAPITSHPLPRPNPTTSTTVKRLSACRTTLPASWTNALSAGSSTLGATSATVLAVSSTGAMVATRDFGTTRDVVVVTASGSPQRIFTVPNPDQMQVVQASIEGDWVLVPVVRLPRNANGVIPTVRELVLVNTTTHATRTIVHLDASETKDPTTIDGAVMHGQSVFWDLKPNFASHTGKVMKYDIDGGHTYVVMSSRVGAPVAHPARVTWPGGTAEFSGVLPPVVDFVVAGDTAAAQSLVSDGSAYAWVSQAGSIRWWAPGATQPVELRPPSISTGKQHFGGLVVAGRYVYVEQNSETDEVRRLIDMRNGATATTTTALLYGGHGIFGADKGPYATQSVLRVDTATLPELHC